MRSINTLLAAAGAAGLSAAAAAQVRLTTTLVVSGMDKPCWVTAAPGDDDRLFITEQHLGNILVYKKSTGTLNPAPFLTVRDLMHPFPLNEQGLLAVAFHPDYQNNGHFYIHYSDASGHNALRRYTRQTADSADAGSGLQVFTIERNPAFTNHYGGAPQFGSDGFLYVSTGDGGSGFDPTNRAANLDLLLGKMLRLDVNGDDFPGDPGRNYAIPPGNPFAGPICGADEIWAFGFRNPWRWSFDRLTGDIYLGDVGQGMREEVNFEPVNTPGRFYGWRCREGTRLTGLTCSSAPCPDVPPTDPVVEYPHDPPTFCAVTGGYVYRGPIESLRGTYFYADFCTATIWSFRWVGGAVTEHRIRTAELDPPGEQEIRAIGSFGQDNEGNVYIVDRGREIYKIVCYADCDQSTGEAVLDVFDFLCFQNRYDANDPYACDCDLSTGPETCDIFDFTCFLNLYDQGCGEK